MYTYCIGILFFVYYLREEIVSKTRAELALGR